MSGADGGHGSAPLRAGRVGRPHGLDGSFYVTRALPRLLAHGASVQIAGRGMSIVRRAGTDRAPIVRLEGVDSRADAEALRGADLEVPHEHAPALREGEWWAHELEGCTVAGGGRTIGIVRRLLELPSCEVLEVERTGAGDLLVPMVADAIVSVEIESRRIELDLNFLDLDEDA